MRTLACLASLCIGCARERRLCHADAIFRHLGAREPDKPRPYRRKKYYQNDQRVNEPVQWEPSRRAGNDDPSSR